MQHLVAGLGDTLCPGYQENQGGRKPSGERGRSFGRHQWRSSVPSPGRDHQARACIPTDSQASQLIWRAGCVPLGESGKLSPRQAAAPHSAHRKLREVTLRHPRRGIVRGFRHRTPSSSAVAIIAPLLPLPSPPWGVRRQDPWHKAATRIIKCHTASQTFSGHPPTPSRPRCRI